MSPNTYGTTKQPGRVSAARIQQILELPLVAQILQGIEDLKLNLENIKKLPRFI